MNSLMKRETTKLPQALGNHPESLMADPGSNFIIPEAGHLVRAWK